MTQGTRAKQLVLLDATKAAIKGNASDFSDEESGQQGERA